MKLTKLLGIALIAMILSLGIIHCGGSATDNDDDDGGATDTSSAATIAQSCFSSASQGANYADMSISAPALIKHTGLTCDYSGDPIECTFSCDSGTATFSYSEANEEMGLSYDSCEMDDITMDGSMDMTYSATATTETIDMTYSSFSVTDSDGTVTMSGDIEMSIDTTLNEATMSWISFSGSDYTGTAFSVTGEVTVDITTNILDGSMTITYGSDSATCTFSNFDADTATAADWANACN